MSGKLKVIIEKEIEAFWGFDDLIADMRKDVKSDEKIAAAIVEILSEDIGAVVDDSKWTIAGLSEQSDTVLVNKSALLNLMRYANTQPAPYPQDALTAFGQLCRDLLAASDSPQEIYASGSALQSEAVQP